MDYYKYYFVYNKKEILLYIGTHDKDTSPLNFKNIIIKYLKFKFQIKDKKFTTDLLHKVYKPLFKRIKFCN